MVFGVRYQRCKYRRVFGPSIIVIESRRTMRDGLRTAHGAQCLFATLLALTGRPLILKRHNNDMVMHGLPSGMVRHEGARYHHKSEYNRQ